MNEELKLLPCPFCGGKAEMEHMHEDNGCPEVYYREWNYYIVKCRNCGASSGYCFNEKIATNEWNSRV